MIGAGRGTGAGAIEGSGDEIAAQHDVRVLVKHRCGRAEVIFATAKERGMPRF
jgi:hypothetical protein